MDWRRRQREFGSGSSWRPTAQLWPKKWKHAWSVKKVKASGEYLPFNLSGTGWTWGASGYRWIICGGASKPLGAQGRTSNLVGPWLFLPPNKENLLHRKHSSRIFWDYPGCGCWIHGARSFFDQKNKTLEITSNVKLYDYINNYEIITHKIFYSKSDEIIKSIGDTEITLNKQYLILSKDIEYQKNKKNLKSSEFSTIIDNSGNKFELENFEFNLEKNILRAKKLKLYDKDKNLLEVENGYVDLNKSEVIGSDFNLKFDNNFFGNPENDPRMIGRYILKNNSGYIVKWKDNSFKKIPYTEGSGPNGIAYDEEDKMLYVNYNQGDKIVSFDMGANEGTSYSKINSTFIEAPDNPYIHQNNIWVTSLDFQPNDFGECEFKESCSLPFSIYQLDKKSLKIINKYSFNKTVFGLPTVAVPFENKIYMGSFHSDRLGVFEVD